MMSLGFSLNLNHTSQAAFKFADHLLKLNFLDNFNFPYNETYITCTCSANYSRLANALTLPFVLTDAEYLFYAYITSQ